MKHASMKKSYISYEVNRFSPSSPRVEDYSKIPDQHRYSKMAQLACKLAEKDIARLILEAKQLKARTGTK